MINYTEKGAGVFPKIADAGHEFRWVENLPVSSDDTAVQAIIDAYTLDECKLYHKLQVDEFASEYRQTRIKAAYGIQPSSEEMSSWAIKRAEAQAFDGNDSSAPIIAIEASARGVTTQAIVDRVLANGTALSQLEAGIAGVAGAHKDAITNLTSFAEVVSYNYSVGYP